MDNKGRFITFEGCDGVGKSTQIRLLKEYLESEGQDAVYLREPGGTSISEKIRDIILSLENADMCDKCEALLYSAARAQLIEEIIKPMLEAGKTVICDRFIDSTLAYQGYARGLGVAYIAKLNEITAGSCIPDVTIFLDLEPSSAFARKKGADANDRLEQEKIDFHQRVYEGYQIAADMFSERIIRISPTGTKFDTNKTIILRLKGRGIIR